MTRPLGSRQLRCLWILHQGWVVLTTPDPMLDSLVRRGLVRLEGFARYYPTEDGALVGAYVARLNGCRVRLGSHLEILRRRRWLNQLVRPEAARKAAWPSNGEAPL